MVNFLRETIVFTCVYVKTKAIPTRLIKIAIRILRINGSASSIVYRSEDSLNTTKILAEFSNREQKSLKIRSCPPVKYHSTWSDTEKVDWSTN